MLLFCLLKIEKLDKNREIKEIAVTVKKEKKRKGNSRLNRHTVKKEKEIANGHTGIQTQLHGYSGADPCWGTWGHVP